MIEIALSRLRGTDIAKACNALLPCNADSPETMTAGVDVEGLGTVAITFEKFRHRHHRTLLWSWQPKKAELVEHVCNRDGPSGSYVDDPGGDNLTTIAPTCSVCGKPQITFD